MPPFPPAHKNRREQREGPAYGRPVKRSKDAVLYGDCIFFFRKRPEMAGTISLGNCPRLCMDSFSLNVAANRRQFLHILLQKGDRVYGEKLLCSLKRMDTALIVTKLLYKCNNSTNLWINIARNCEKIIKISMCEKSQEINKNADFVKYAPNCDDGF